MLDSLKNKMPERALRRNMTLPNIKPILERLKNKMPERALRLYHHHLSFSKQSMV